MHTLSAAGQKLRELWAYAMRAARKEIPSAESWLPPVWAVLIIGLGVLTIVSRGETLVIASFATSVAVFPMLMLDVRAGALSRLALAGAVIVGLGPTVQPVWHSFSGRPDGDWVPVTAAVILTVLGGCLIHLGNRNLIAPVKAVGDGAAQTAAGLGARTSRHSEGNGATILVPTDESTDESKAHRPQTRLESD